MTIINITLMLTTALIVVAVFIAALRVFIKDTKRRSEIEVSILKSRANHAASNILAQITAVKYDQRYEFTGELEFTTSGHIVSSKIAVENPYTDAAVLAVIENGVYTKTDLLKKIEAKINPPVQKKVIMYATARCPFCVRARELFKKNGIKFGEIRITNDHAVRMEMEKLSGRTSVPQIFFDGEHMGGYDDIKNLDIKRLLNAS